jgi:hypothetical protein
MCFFDINKRSYFKLFHDCRICRGKELRQIVSKEYGKVSPDQFLISGSGLKNTQCP